MKEYLFNRVTGELIRDQKMHIDPLESKKQGRTIYLQSACGTTEMPPERKEGYAVVWNGNTWGHVEDHRGVTVWKSYEESMEIRELGPIPDGWTVEQPEKPVTMDDYDNAMEAHITATRVARGYTTREPDCYINSRNERRAQDAEDFIAFRDAVMDYAAAVREEYRTSGTVPSLEEFKHNLPQIEWSIE